MIPQNNLFLQLAIEPRDPNDLCSKDQNQFYCDSCFYQGDCQHAELLPDELGLLQSSIDSLDFEEQEELEVQDQPNTCQKSQRVSFSTVQVREYKVILGDCRSLKKYPMTLDWSYGPSTTYSLDDLPPKKPQRTRYRSSYIKSERGEIDTLICHAGRPVPLSTEERKSRLTEMGCSSQQFLHYDRRLRARKALEGITDRSLTLYQGENTKRKYFVRHLL